MYLFLFVLGTLFANTICEHKDAVAPKLKLNDGNEIPALGLGTFLGFDENGQREVDDGAVESPVTWALNAGYRLIDTAAAYNNEDQVGKAIKESSVPREEIFVVTKLAPHSQRQVVDALKESLRLLNMTYVDLFLIHNPVAFLPNGSYDVIDYVDTWKSMEEAKKLGLTKSIGISNFNESQILRLLENCEVKPAVLQVEVNLNLAQTKLRELCKTHDIVVMAYTPFGSLFRKEGDAPPPKVDDPALVGLAEKYKKTVPQIVLRYLVQLEVVPIPKSENKERIEQNIDVFDFELSDEDMETLKAFNKDFRTVHPSFWQDHPYYPFEIKDVTERNLFEPKN